MLFLMQDHEQQPAAIPGLIVVEQGIAGLGGIRSWRRAAAGENTGQRTRGRPQTIGE